MDCSTPGSYTHTRILEWVVVSFFNSTLPMLYLRRECPRNRKDWIEPKISSVWETKFIWYINRISKCPGVKYSRNKSQVNYYESWLCDDTWICLAVITPNYETLVYIVFISCHKDIYVRKNICLKFSKLGVSLTI